MGEHTFTSRLLLTGKTKNGRSRLRVSVGIRDYEYITHNEDVVYFTDMEIKRSNGEIVKVHYPKISKGSTLGSYTPHYITVPIEDVINNDLKVKEPVVVKVKW